mmetsp:Transcript_11302/g.16932  ORF Transcript_11302/g.16932 Transcript_11302/m.16932 type:complete len:95 (-) Transcript_11302:1959-2243(-)
MGVLILHKAPFNDIHDIHLRTLAFRLQRKQAEAKRTNFTCLFENKLLFVLLHPVDKLSTPELILRLGFGLLTEICSTMISPTSLPELSRNGIPP